MNDIKFYKLSFGNSFGSIVKSESFESFDGVSSITDSTRYRPTYDIVKAMTEGADGKMEFGSAPNFVFDTKSGYDSKVLDSVSDRVIAVRSGNLDISEVEKIASEVKKEYIDSAKKASKKAATKKAAEELAASKKAAEDLKTAKSVSDSKSVDLGN